MAAMAAPSTAATGSASTGTSGTATWARKENWDQTASSYDDAVGPYSRAAAERLVTVADAALPFSGANTAAIDLGAGTGSIAHTVAARFPEVPVTASDVSEGMLATLRAKTAPGARVTTAVVDMGAPLAGPDGAARAGAYSHVLSGYALQALESPQAGVNGMHALLRPGGVVALASWAFDAWCGPNEVWRAAATAADPSWRDPILDRELRTSLPQLREYLAAAGFRDIRAETWRGAFGLPPQGLMHFFWEGNNPWARECRAGFPGNLDSVKAAMQKILDEQYAGVDQILIDSAIVTAIK